MGLRGIDQFGPPLGRASSLIREPTPKFYPACGAPVADRDPDAGHGISLCRADGRQRILVSRGFSAPNRPE
jgi:hypothetical protein